MVSIMSFPEYALSHVSGPKTSLRPPIKLNESTRVPPPAPGLSFTSESLVAGSTSLNSSRTLSAVPTGSRGGGAH